MIVKILATTLYFWHYFLSQLTATALGQPTSCRFYPSCSVYTLLAIKKFGLIKGLRLGIVRVLRCQPFGKAGFEYLK